MYPYGWPVPAQSPITYHYTTQAGSFQLLANAHGIVYRINTSTGETWKEWGAKWILIQEPEINDNGQDEENPEG